MLNHKRAPVLWCCVVDVGRRVDGAHFFPLVLCGGVW